ncbi:hypothetical protein C8R45DRAFT_1156211 [Mycena sanguinolenta]|nr:hypothetical protein C8R45DRAFT_1156211 [Mycena sanguinolenta]
MRAAVLVSLFAALGAIAAPATTQILTPKGYRSASNAVEVPAGGKIVHIDETSLHVLDSKGAVVHVASKAATTNSSAVTPEASGWIAYASYFNNGAPIGSFQATWSVPPAPANFDGQTLFLFNSIEPGTFDAIMQPVLQYGGSAAGGSEYWAVANWYLYGDNTYYTTPVQVSPGQQLVGEVGLVGTDGNSYDYISAFTNLNVPSLTVDGGEQLQWATITLETYSTTSSSDYPTGSTVFSGINLELTSGEFPSINWDVQSDPADGITATVNVEGSTSAVVTITY